MPVHVLLFASLAEKAGVRTLELPLAVGACVRDVRDQIFARFPELRPFQDRIVYAVDEEYAREDTLVSEGATLALIPPVSGG